MDKKPGSCCLTTSHQKSGSQSDPCSSYLVMKHTDHTVKTLQASKQEPTSDISGYIHLLYCM